MRRLSFAAFALIAFGGNAWAWGDEGHRVVCHEDFECVVILFSDDGNVFDAHN
jgi:hypothetical protein